MKIKQIKWRDSKMFITQISRDELEDVCVIESIGYVIDETEHSVTLAGDLVDSEFRRVIVIPKENILST